MTPGTQGYAARRLVVAIAVLAAALAAYQLTRPGLLLGDTPDVSVYLGAAVRLVHGATPYRDYVFVQPPGFVILAAPIGLLSDATGTRDALGVLRLLMPLLAAANVLLVGRLLRHRGPIAIVVACTVMACFPAELYAIRGPQLEPVVALFCLVGVALIFEGDGFSTRRRMAAGGAALGVATAVKLSALIPIVMLLVVVMVAARRRGLAAVAGVVGGFAILTLPFAALAPGAFWRDTVATQVARVPASSRASVLTRLGEMTGLSEIAAPAALVIGVSAGVVALVVVAFLASRRGPTPLEWFALTSTGGVAAAQFAPAQYYPQYAALLAPFVSILLGLALSRVTESVSRRMAVRLVAALAGAALFITQGVFVHGESTPDFAAVVDAVVPSGACVLANAPVYLVTTDRFQSSVPGCTDMTEPAGTVLALPANSSDAVHVWEQAFGSVDYVVTDRPIDDWQLPEAARIAKYVAANFHLRRPGTLLVYVRFGSPTAPG